MKGSFLHADHPTKGVPIARRSSITEETTAIPQNLRYYIDWQAMARDCELNGDLFTIQTTHDAVHVFAGC